MARRKEKGGRVNGRTELFYHRWENVGSVEKKRRGKDTAAATTAARTRPVIMRGARKRKRKKKRRGWRMGLFLFLLRPRSSFRCISWKVDARRGREREREREKEIRAFALSPH